MIKNLRINKYLSGFTLTEVLVTLAIIGIVAALTIPNLLVNLQNQQNKVAFKETYSNFARATTTLLMDKGGSFKNLCVTYDHDCIKDLYKTYLNYSKECPKNGAYGQCFHPVTGGYGGTLDTVYGLNGGTHMSDNILLLFGSGDSGLILSNGQLVIFSYQDATCTGANGGWIEASNICGWITVDVNGFKGPNTVGRDIFVIDIVLNGIKPTGTGSLSGTCRTNDSGQGCAAFVLENIDY